MTLKHDDIREKLIQATLKLLDEGGLENVKARKLAANVGISVGTIYNIFGNVDKLVQEVSAHILSDMNKMGQVNVARSETDLEQKIASGEIKDELKEKLRFRLLALASTYMEFIEANSERWGAMLAYNRNRSEGAVADWYVVQQNALFDLVGNVLAQTRFGKNPKTRMIAARALWSAVHGIVTMSYVGQVSDKSRAFTWAQIELLVNTFVDGL